MTVEPGWSLLEVQTHLRYQDPTLRTLLRWDPDTQRYLPIAVGTMLEPGRVYLGYTDTPTTPFTKACLPRDITAPIDFEDATRLLLTCPFDPRSAAIIPRLAWTHRHLPTGPPRPQGTSHLVLHHTGTATTTNIVALEDLWLLDRGAPTFPYHFVVAPNHTGQWQIYEGRPMPGLAGPDSPALLPQNIHIAVMGTYTPIRTADLEDTHLGYTAEDPASKQQPALTALLRLAELVLFLKHRHPTIRGFLENEAMGQKSTAPLSHSMKRTAWPPGTRHIVDALQSRYFRPDAPSDQSETYPIPHAESTSESDQDDHIFVAWVEQGNASTTRDRIATTQAFWGREEGASRPSQGPEHRPQGSMPAPAPSGATTPPPAGAQPNQNPTLETSGAADGPLAESAVLISGPPDTALGWSSPPLAPASALASVPQDSSYDLAQGTRSLVVLKEPAPVNKRTIDGNLQRALTLKNDLLRSIDGPRPVTTEPTTSRTASATLISKKATPKNALTTWRPQPG